MSLSDFLALANNATSVSGVLIRMEVSFFLLFDHLLSCHAISRRREQIEDPTTVLKILIASKT